MCDYDSVVWPPYAPLVYYTDLATMMTSDDLPQLLDLTTLCAGKQHYSRKDSADSGISGNMSRKTSTVSQLSCSSIAEEPTEETIKEETVFVEPDDDLCEKITQQVRHFFYFYYTVPTKNLYNL
jgi:hypothetical protein